MENFSVQTNFAIETARKCGSILMEYYAKEKLEFERKAYNDIATEADKASEKAAIEAIRSKFPDHTIVAEESGLYEKESKYRWHIDPLDGTTNFKHRVPVFAVSIGLEVDGEVVTGVVFLPYLNELFVAEKGKGAYLNEKPIKVTDLDQAEMSLVATGFLPYKTAGNKNLDVWCHVMREGHQARRLGAASVDLCYTACGRFDAFWEFGLHSWDIAAGIIIVKEAGGTVTDTSNNPIKVDSESIVASNGKMHERMLRLVNEGLQ